MSDLIITKTEEGRLQGLGDKHARAYERWRRAVEALPAGGTLHFSYREPRSPGNHRRFFAMLHALYERQEQFDDMDRLRQWLTVGAGYCSLVPGPKGRMVAIPDSISWARMDEAEFVELIRRVWEFLWTEHARRFLWGHMSDDQTHASVDALLLEFDR